MARKADGPGISIAVTIRNIFAKYPSPNILSVLIVPAMACLPLGSDDQSLVEN